jgi:hypothetical protein
MMKIPVIRGLIDRRILVNYRCDPAVLADLLPEPFRPKLVNGTALVGICLIRLKHVRPAFSPSWLGVSSENGAHRAAVEWNDNGNVRQGVYIFHRFTSSWFNALAGGRLFSGALHHARFTVAETNDHCSVSLNSDLPPVHVAVRGHLNGSWPQSSAFGSFDEASHFYEAGSMGFAPTTDPTRFEGTQLRCRDWIAEPLEIEETRSSFFDDETRFPKGSIEHDSALWMRGIEHEWHSTPEICCGANCVNV